MSAGLKPISPLRPISPLGLVVRVEQTDWLPMITKRDASAIREALETAGVIFVEMSDEGHGVQVRKVEG